MIAALLGDDEHTGTDDAYSRALKCRKWVVLSAVAFFLVHDHRFAPEVFTILVGKVTLPIWIWEHVTAGALAYSAIQYVAILVQLAIRYRIILETRFGLRQYREVMRYISEIEALGHELASIKERDRNGGHSERYLAAQNRIATLREKVEQMPASPPPGVAYSLAEGVIDGFRLGAPVVTLVIALLPLWLG